MSLTISNTSHVRAGAAVAERSTRAGLLTSTALATALIAITSGALISGAQANTVTVGGLAAPDATPLFILVAPGNLDTVVNVNTTNITGAAVEGVRVIGFAGKTDLTVDAGKSISGVITGAYLTSTTGNNTATINGTVTGSAYGIIQDARFAGDGGNVTVKGTGAVTGTGAAAIWLLADTGKVTVDGLAGGIKGGTFGILVNANGTYTGNPGGAINLGITTALGPITTTAGSGIYVDEVFNAFGNGAINVKATDITATGGYGVRTVGWAAVNNVTTTGAVKSTLAGVYATTSTGDITLTGGGTGTVDSTADSALVADSRFAPLGGNNVIKDYKSVTGALAGIWSLTDIGTNTIDNIGSINAGTWGILANATGAVNIGQGTAIGPINAGGIGIEVVQVLDAVNNGAINVAATDINAVGYGVHTLGWAKDTTITTTGTVNSTASTAIYGTSTDGNITVSGDGTGVVKGALEGITLDPVAGIGNATVKDFVSVTGARTGLWLLPDTGNVTVDNVGTVTGTTVDGILAATLGGNISIQNTGNTGGINGAVDAVYANALTGDINIGGTATNGVITGGANGINAVTAGKGNIAITTNKDVTGTAVDGIIAWAGGGGAGNVAIDVTGGNVTGLIYGIDARDFGTGNAGVNIAAGSTVKGTTEGLVTATVSGTATTNNAGIIKNTVDTGAASDSGALAILAFTGTNVVNNTGQIIGGVATSDLSFTLNNIAGGVWTPNAVLLANPFAGVSDTVNNAGLINIRTGTTTFAALEAFNNLSGGNINLAYSPAATDTLNVLNFSPKAGSIITTNFDASAPLGVGDAGTLGTADTIVVFGTSTPVAVSKVNIVATGGTNGAGEPAPLTGSVAIVQTAAGGILAAPKVGDTLVASTFYTIGAGDPTTGLRVFALVDDGKGGVYLQWVPNVSATSLGGFGGAVAAASASGTSGGPTGGSSSGTFSPGAAIASAAAGLSGVGGVGLSGGPTGGGAAGHVADMAAGSVLPLNTTMLGQDAGAADAGDNGQLPAGTMNCSSNGQTNAWVQGEVSRSNYSHGGDGRNDNLSGGVETTLGETTGFGCNRLALGIFGFTGDTVTSWSTGRAKTSDNGVGGYIRAASAIGLYGSLLGAASWSDSDLTNNAYGSTANKNATNFTGVATIGYIARLAADAAIDLRTYVAYGNADGDGFKDSKGIAVSGTNDDLVTVGASLGLYAPIAPSTQGFVRGGVKWAQVDSSITAFGVKQSGSVNEVAGSAEAGFVANAGGGVQLGISGFGEFSDSTTTYGGRAHVGVKF
jgi:hypothetical protein